MGNNTKHKKIILVVGPTAVGKTAVAIELATHFQTAIISADSRQCYKELNIGVARPSTIELDTIKHYFIASHSIGEDVTAHTFEMYALQKAEQLFEQHQQIILAGGTGLYIDAFCSGLDTIPEVESSVRENIITQYKERGIGWLQQQLQEKDKLFFQRGEMKNPQRMMRALEVVENTGQSILQFQKNSQAQRDFSVIKLGLNLPREILINRINERVDKMMQDGLLEEVKSLLPFKHKNALQTVGYKELFAYLDGDCTLDEAIERIKISTRQYAKRQMTWFQKEKTIKWFAPNQLREMIAYITS